MQRYCLTLVLACSMLSCAGRADTAASRTDGSVRSAKSSETTAVARPTDFQFQFEEAAKAIEPAVVSITSISAVKGGEMESPFAGTPFEFFFHQIPAPQQRQMLRRGIGSGVIVNTNGDVLTNNHVVEGADTVKVTLSDNREVEAKVVGTDPKTDLAVVKIDPDGLQLKAAQLGDSDKLQVGQWVIAAGSPFGLRQTVSAGIVSAVGRGNVGIAEYEDFIQTDAAINPGNSGGPLVDLAGRVVGIDTAIASQSGGNNGVGFAIPINMARTVMKQLIEHGKVIRGYIGLYISNVGEDLAQSFGYKGSGGALVQDVSSTGPGAQAGLKPGDIITQLDGQPVKNATDFRNAIAAHAPGNTVDLTVFRSGGSRDVKVKLKELPANGAAHARQQGENPVRWGLELSDITPALKQRLNLNLSQGAVIIEVKPGSPADDAGLHAGDVIASIGDTEIHDAEQAQRVLLTSKSPIRLRVVRDGRGMFLILNESQ